ncbi:hypothetical protein HYD72_00835 [Mycoplasmopsis bovis]|nr:hypothetical protein [Mycoplasmopsis bovis]QQH49233.1 hypothetical protein HYD72_00835 [Mycoplasmopsis bovis]
MTKLKTLGKKLKSQTIKMKQESMLSSTNNELSALITKAEFATVICLIT